MSEQPTSQKHPRHGLMSTRVPVRISSSMMRSLSPETLIDSAYSSPSTNSLVSVQNSLVISRHDTSSPSRIPPSKSPDVRTIRETNHPASDWQRGHQSIVYSRTGKLSCQVCERAWTTQADPERHVSLDHHHSFEQEAKELQTTIPSADSPTCSACSLSSSLEIDPNSQYPSPAKDLYEVLNLLCTQFAGWQAGNKRALDETNTNSDAPPAQERTQVQSHINSTKPDERDSKEGPKSQPQLKKCRTDKRQHRSFACPFWKKDPRTHRDCGKLTLTRVKDVKQHLGRSRTHKPCPCSESHTRDSEQRNDQDAGNQGANACRLHPTRPVGLTDKQHKELQKRGNGKLSEEEQWFCVWDIVFPGTPRPRSPYVDNDLSPDLAEFREYTASPVAAELFRVQLALDGYRVSGPDDRPHLINAAISASLDRIYDSWLSGHRDNPNQITPAPDNFPLLYSSPQASPPQSGHGVRTSSTSPTVVGPVRLPHTDSQSSNNHSLFYGANPPGSTFTPPSLPSSSTASSSGRVDFGNEYYRPVHYDQAIMPNLAPPIPGVTQPAFTGSSLQDLNLQDVSSSENSVAGFVFESLDSQKRQ